MCFGIFGMVTDAVKCVFLTPIILMMTFLSAIIFTYLIKASIAIRLEGSTYWSSFGHWEFYKWDEDFFWSLYVVVVSMLIMCFIYLFVKYLHDKIKRAVDLKNHKIALMEVLRDHGTLDYQKKADV
jgi:hypothetical protein